MCVIGRESIIEGKDDEKEERGEDPGKGGDHVQEVAVHKEGDAEREEENGEEREGKDGNAVV